MREEKTLLIIFGGTGDLMKRKLVQAFLSMNKSSNLEDISIICIGRRDFDDNSYKNFLASESNIPAIEINSLPISYFKNDFSENEGLLPLKKFIQELGEFRNLIFYLATSYEFFPEIVRNIKKSGLGNAPGFTRIAFEKPFGIGLESSAMLDSSIKELFSEKDIYRIDHYLAKPGVKELISLKKNKDDFEKSLSRGILEKVEIISDENLGVSSRIESYNKMGAIRDMIQSHLLQVVSLVLAEPDFLNDNILSREKAKALSSLQFIEDKYNLLGQYLGYLEETRNHGIINSRTETFARLVIKSNIKKWESIPIILRTGKKLKEKKGEIKFFFNDTKKNITINIHGNGSSLEYTDIISSLMQGNHAFSAGITEIQEAWKLVKDIEAKKDRIKMISYSNSDNIP